MASLGKRFILIALCCPLFAACNYQTSTSTSASGAGGITSNTMTYRSNDFASELKTNGELKIKDGAVESLADGQVIELTITEGGTRHEYRITKTSEGIKTEKTGSRVEQADEARIKKALSNMGGTGNAAVAVQQSISQSQAPIINHQADVIEKQAEALRRQADALQKQADALRKQAGK